MSTLPMKIVLLMLGMALAVGMIGCASEAAEEPVTPPAAEEGGGVETDAGGAEEEPATVEPAQLTEEKCSGCHEYSRVTSATKDAAGWESTVDRMISNGMVISADERQIIIDYLSGSE